jgi:hypothetical protein
MATGEGVSIAVKNKEAISNDKWRVPAFMCGNKLPLFNDNSGSISRRLLVFYFTTLIKDRNTTMVKDIEAHELVTILLRCIFKYRQYAVDLGSRDFWKNAPKSLVDVQSSVKEQTNSLANFLANGDQFYQVVYNPASTTSLDELNVAYSNHMKYVHKEIKATIGSDHFPLKSAGFLVETQNLCKTCHQKCSKKTCGEKPEGHYDDKNRYKKVMIAKMELKRLKPKRVQEDTGARHHPDDYEKNDVGKSTLFPCPTKAK